LFLILDDIKNLVKNSLIKGVVLIQGWSLVGILLYIEWNQEAYNYSLKVIVIQMITEASLSNQ
jgi:hypothetical protein